MDANGSTMTRRNSLEPDDDNRRREPGQCAGSG